MTQINLEIWGDDSDEAKEEIPLGAWVLDNGRLMRADDPEVSDSNSPQLSPDEVLILIQKQLSGQDLSLDKHTMEAYRKASKRSSISGVDGSAEYDFIEGLQ